jgi:uncharacterized delta-60 repeat protein
LLLSALTAIATFATTSHSASGDLDATFGTGGVAIVPSSSSGAYAVAIQDDGKIVTAGYASGPSSVDMAVVRLDDTGVLDASFGTGGVVTLPAGLQSIAEAIALQPDGKILVGGGVFVAPFVYDYEFRLVRLLAADGQLDGSFGDGGIVEMPAAATQPGIHSVVLQPDGRILVAGEGKADVTSSKPNRDMLVVRYLADGTPDSGFGDGGSALVSMGRRYDAPRSVLLQPDGAIVAAGYAIQGRSARAAVMRLTSSGVLDESFGRRGRQRLRFSTRLSYGIDAALLADGRIVLGGLSVGNDILTARMALAQLTTTGTRDQTFGVEGVAEAAPDAPAYYHPSRIVVQADGKIVMVGDITRGDGASDIYPDVLLARFMADGSLDASFGDGGVVRSVFNQSDYGFGVTLDGSGNIVVVGSSYDGTQARTLVARYLP